MTHVYVVFYSMYGHVYRMAEAIAEGARSQPDVDVSLWRVPETVPQDVLERSGAAEAQAQFAHIPTIEPTQLAEADALIFGTPTRFGNMSAQMRNFLDQTGGLWAKGALIGKVGSVFASTATQHGGHLGMIVVGVPYSQARLTEMGEITGGTPYGATTLAGTDGSRLPSENELAIARFQGAHVASIAARLRAS